MEILNNRKERTHEELCSLSEMLSSICSEDHHEINPLQEIFGSNSSSSTLVFSEPKDVTKNNDHIDTSDHYNRSNRNAKRQRSMEYRVMMEKKRRQLIRDKVDILQEVTPNCAKSDLATKLESIVEYIKTLKQHIDMMSKVYTQPAGCMSPFYGAQAPCISPYTSPWGYYAPGLPLTPHQNMPFIPQFHHQVLNTPPDQTQ